MDAIKEIIDNLDKYSFLLNKENIPSTIFDRLEILSNKLSTLIKADKIAKESKLTLEDYLRGKPFYKLCKDKREYYIPCPNDEFTRIELMYEEFINVVDDMFSSYGNELSEIHFNKLYNMFDVFFTHSYKDIKEEFVRIRLIFEPKTINYVVKGEKFRVAFFGKKVCCGSIIPFFKVVKMKLLD